MSRFLHKIHVVTPASVANLGSGFDCIALALDGLDNEFTFFIDERQLEEAHENEFEIDLNGEHKDTDLNMRAPKQGNLCVVSFQSTCRYLCAEARLIVPRCPIFLRQEVRIPPARGLGSSSSACIAGVLAAIRFLDIIYPGRFRDRLDDKEMCASLAAREDNCPDNVCACLAGGMTYCFIEDPPAGRPLDLPRLHYFKQEIGVSGRRDRDLRIVALVPDHKIGTPLARDTLMGCHYELENVIFNITRSTCIPAVFRSGQYELLSEVLKDRIHQKQRVQKLYIDDRRRNFDLQRIFTDVIQAGAYGACIGGAGSTLVAFADEAKVMDVKEAFRSSFLNVAPRDWNIEIVRVFKPRNEEPRVDVGLSRLSEGSTLPGEWPSMVATWIDRAPGQRAVVKGPAPAANEIFQRERSERGKLRAIFLSYAHEDREAARVLKKSLEENRIEVWLDETELLGGDRFVGKIHDQIDHCALFIPLISSTTEARREAWFRREWAHAIQRAEGMHEDVPFILPVNIDGTTVDKARLVPNEFKHFQWTNCPGGWPPKAFIKHLSDILSDG